MRQRKKFSDKQLLQEFYLAQMVPDKDVPKPKPDEFERIWERIQSGREKKSAE